VQTLAIIPEVILNCKADDDDVNDDDNDVRNAMHSFIHSQALIVQDGPLASLFGVS
jgi:hypothetical protein